MNLRPGLALWGCVVMSACQSPLPSAATIVDAEQVVQVPASTRVPEALFRLAGVVLAPGDQVLDHGAAIDANHAVPPGRAIYLQVRRPVQVLVNGEPLQTTAQTVGEALSGAGIELHVVDAVDPPADSPVVAGLVIKHVPARVAHLQVDGTETPLRSTSSKVGAALAESGIPVLGLDSVVPFEQDLFPEEGGIRLARITEALVLVQEPIRYQSRSQDSPDLELGVEQVLEPGLSGLAVARTRIRYEEGVEVSRQVESQAVVRPPKERLVIRGTKIVEKTTSVDGLTITYWRTIQMYATVYSPCNSGTSDGSCSAGTASGLPAGKGVVAVDPGLFAFLNGQRLYIPGYGYAVVGDVGGGFIIEQNLGISRYKWIDLGFDDNNILDMTGWLTVYFLPPVPASIPDALK
ncbi:MAG: G5 domain-containing protein [Chloroflexota bacterium]